MAPWACLRVNYIPLTLCVVFCFGLIFCYVLAVAIGDVTPYVPFISETGGRYPEAGIFSMFLYFGATLGYTTIFVRFLIVSELNRGIDRGIEILNKASLLIGSVALMGMVVVAAYPMTSIMTAHGIGANVLFIGCVIYGALQTWMSFKMSPYYNGLTICYIRLAITIFSALALVTLLIVGPLASGAWYSQKHPDWTGKKEPGDKGFDLMVAAAASEWTMAIMFVAYYFTFINEFGKVNMHLHVRLLVEHFDDDPHDKENVVATERTPIVM